VSASAKLVEIREVIDVSDAARRFMRLRITH
jgi:hypothetical protein